MKTDKDIILDIVAKAFAESPRFQAIMKNGKPEKRLRIMAEYAYDVVEKKNGIYLSEDKSTVIFYYTKKEFKRSLYDFYKYVRMFFLCIRPEKAFSTLRREKLVESLRPDIPDYIYVWVLGSDPERTSIHGLADIRDHLFGESVKRNLPILMETTVKKVLKLYKYVGFEVYNEFYDKTIDMPVWMLKRGDIGKSDGSGPSSE